MNMINLYSTKFEIEFEALANSVKDIINESRSSVSHRFINYLLHTYSYFDNKKIEISYMTEDKQIENVKTTLFNIMDLFKSFNDDKSMDLDEMIVINNIYDVINMFYFKY